MPVFIGPLDSFIDSLSLCHSDPWPCLLPAFPRPQAWKWWSGWTCLWNLQHLIYKSQKNDTSNCGLNELIWSLTARKCIMDNDAYKRFFASRMYTCTMHRCKLGQIWNSQQLNSLGQGMTKTAHKLWISLRIFAGSPTTSFYLAVRLHLPSSLDSSMYQVASSELIRCANVPATWRKNQVSHWSA